MSKKITRRVLPAPSNHCFGCGKANPQSMRLKFTYDETTREIATSFRLSKRYSGPPGYCHGGIIATILDEAMAKLNQPHQVTAVTAHMAIDYLRPVPLNQPLRAQARETANRGRRRFRSATLLNDEGTALACATGIFIAIDPQKILGRSV